MHWKKNWKKKKLPDPFHSIQGHASVDKALNPNMNMKEVEQTSRTAQKLVCYIVYVLWQCPLTSLLISSQYYILGQLNLFYTTWYETVCVTPSTFYLPLASASECNCTFPPRVLQSWYMPVTPIQSTQMEYSQVIPLMFSGGVIPTHSPHSMVSVTSRDCTKPGLTPLVTPVLLIQQTVHMWLDVYMSGFV